VIVETRWFRVRSGPTEGQLRLSGWTSTALPDGTGGWFQLGVCPRCGALVWDTFGNLGGHERWHAATDFPIPAGL
jgi:hypothetical protein